MIGLLAAAMVFSGTEDVSARDYLEQSFEDCSYERDEATYYDTELLRDAITYMRYSSDQLSDSERETIVNTIKFSIKKVYYNLEKADEEARKITNVRTRELMLAAISGAIGGMQGKSPWAVGIGAALAVIGSQVTSSTQHYLNSRDYIKKAETYADHADYLQNVLLMGEWY